MYRQQPIMTMIGTLIVGLLIVAVIAGAIIWMMYEKEIKSWLGYPEENTEETVSVPTAENAKYSMLGWYSNDKYIGQVAEIELGQTVEYRMRFINLSGHTVNIQIRKDLRNSLDNLFVEETTTLTSDNEIAKVVGTPDEITDGVREYFIQFSIDNKDIKYEGYDNPNQRPRLTVKQAPEPIIQTAGFCLKDSNNPQTNLTVSVSNNVDVYLKISNSGSTNVDRSIRCEIRKVVSVGSDITAYTFDRKTITISSGTNWYKIGTFTPNEKGDYFVRASTSEDEWTYNPETSDRATLTVIIPANLTINGDISISGSQITGFEGQRTNVFTCKQNASLTASTSVQNIGDMSGTGTVELYIDGSKVQSKDITLNAGGITNVSFSFSLSSVGTHKVKIVCGSTTTSEKEIDVVSSIIVNVQTASDGSKYGWVRWGGYNLGGDWFTFIRDGIKAGTTFYIYAIDWHTTPTMIVIHTELRKDIQNATDQSIKWYHTKTISGQSTKDANTFFNSPWNCSVGDTYFNGSYTFIYVGNYTATDTTGVSSFRSYFAQTNDDYGNKYGSGFDWNKRPCVFVGKSATQMGVSGLSIYPDNIKIGGGVK